MAIQMTVEQSRTWQRGFEIGEQAVGFYDPTALNPHENAKQWAITEDRLEGNYPPVDTLLEDPAFQLGMSEGLHHAMYVAPRRRSI